MLAFMDMLAIHLSFLFSLYILNIHSENLLMNYFSFSKFLWLFSFSVFAIYYFQYSNLYKIQTIYNSFSHSFLIVKSSMFVVLGFIIFQFATTRIEYESRLFFLIWLCVLILVLLCLRVPVAKMLATTTFLKDRVIIIGAGEKGRGILNLFHTQVKFKEAVGFIDDDVSVPTIDNVPVIGKIKDAKEIFESNCVDYFILAIDNLKREQFYEIFKFFKENKLPFYVSSTYVKVIYEKLNLDRFGESGMVRFNSSLDNKLFDYAKRLFDIVASAIGIIIFSPFFLIIGLLVKFSSKGQLFYKQIRIGKGGKPFYFYKFRTMYLNSDKDVERKKSVEAFIKGEFVSDNGFNKIVNKSRITPIGYYLRKYSLDELPQLFNVLKGDMSLVGARPCIVSEWKVYDDWQKLRLDFIPGCTGLWQVCGRSEVDFEDSVLMDVYYNQNHSLWFDFKIILKTFSVILNGKGGG